MNPSLAEQLSPLLAYRNAPDHPPEPLQSNWSVTPANDNASHVAQMDFKFERELRMTPSVQEIMRQVDLGPVEKNEDGQVVAIGKLKFSDGTQTERAFATGPDGELVQYRRTMEVGAMLNTREQVESMLGGRGFNDVDLDNSNKFYADLFDTPPARFIKRGKRRSGPSLTAAQSRVMLAEAIANTPNMPAVTICPPGLPCGHEKVGDSFIGYLKPPNGKSGSIAWQDIGQTIENAKIWRKVRAALKTKDLKVIDAAMIAQTLEDVGVAAGQAPNYAKYRGGGKRALIAANDNLMAAINRHSSGSV